MGQVKKLDIVGFESRIEGDSFKGDAFGKLIKADNELVKADQILSDCGMEGITPIGYSSRAEKISLLFDDACKLINYPTDLVEGLTGVDARFAAGVQKALSALNTIRIDDIRIKNDFGVTRKEREFDEYEFTYKEVLKEDLTLDDFVGHYDSLSSYGTSYVKVFTDLLYSPYITDEKDLQDTVIEKSDEIHELLYGDEFGNYSNIIAVMGYDPIMEEILSIEDMKRAALSGGYYSLLKGPSCGATKGVIAYLSTLGEEADSMSTSEVFTCLGAKELETILLTSCSGIKTGYSITQSGVSCLDYYTRNKEEIIKNMDDIEVISSENNDGELDPDDTKSMEAIFKKIKQKVVSFIPQKVPNEMVIDIMHSYATNHPVPQEIIEKNAVNNKDNITSDIYCPGNYIENQGYWGDVRYGLKDMAFSGCEIIAVINAYHSMGKDLSKEEVVDLISSFEEKGPFLYGILGTSPMALVDYLKENTDYSINYTSSTDYNEIEKMGECSDTIIVTLYNEKNDLWQQVHTINIEKAIDGNGDLVFYNHNANWYDDNNGDKDGEPDKDEMCQSPPYYSLEEAIKNSHRTNNSASIMVIGINRPRIGDFPESEAKA